MTQEKSYNAVCEFVDRNIDRGFGDKPAFIDPERTLTYAQLRENTCKIANILTNLGLKREMRVGILMLDGVDYPGVFWGAIRAGIIPVCLNTMLTGPQYDYMLRDSRVEILLISSQLLAVVKQILPQIKSLKTIIVTDNKIGAANSLNLETLLADAKPDFATVEASPDETAFWLYSSGSTGDPKGTRHVHSSLAHVAKYYGSGVLGLRHDDISFSVAKLFFAYGLGASFAMAMSVGATSLLLPSRPTPQAVLDIMMKHNPTLFYGVPTLYAAMLADKNLDFKDGATNLRRCISAGEALPAEIGHTWKKRIGVDIIDGIGSTEMLHIFLSNRPDDIKYGTSGKEFEGYKLRLVDDAGKDVGQDEIGELLVSGTSAADGYWNQREKSRATFVGNWTRTGDKYFRDKDDYYHYCGRTDDMFKVSGIWVSPFEVEQALISHPKILEAAVVAKFDKEKLHKPKAFVVLKNAIKPDEEQALLEELKVHVKSAIGQWKYPRWIEFVSELPKTATGKIQRFKLRE